MHVSITCSKCGNWFPLTQEALDSKAIRQSENDPDGYEVPAEPRCQSYSIKNGITTPIIGPHLVSSTELAKAVRKLKKMKADTAFLKDALK